MKSPHPSKAGSALLITLLVVSLLLMSVLAFSVQVRMSLREVRNSMDMHVARQNARLGMELALAQLQETAGQDQRVTATAAILGNAAHADNRWVTGVWDTQAGSGAEPRWLISTPTQGVNYDISAAPGGLTALLLGQGSAGANANSEKFVRAPLVPIPAPTGAVGHYAFWVADEGVKASLGLYDQFASPGGGNAGQLHATEVQRMRYGVPVRVSQELALGNNTDFDEPGMIAGLQRLVGLEQMSLLNGLPDPRADGGFHDFTLNARGLLTHPLNGGVKKDLSLAPGLLGNGFARFMNFPAYMEQPNAGNALVRVENDLRRMHEITPPNTLNPGPDEIVHSVVPVITDFGLQFVPHVGGSRRGIMSMHFVLELWNPYSSGLVAEDLVVEITGMQPITMFVGDDWQHTFDVEQTYGETIRIRLNREQYHVTRHLHPESHDVYAHGPGRLLYWSGPDTNNDRTPPETGSFANRQVNQTRWVLNAVPAMTFPAHLANSDSVRYQMDETQLTITLRKAPENGGDVLAVYRDFLYDEVDSGVMGNLSGWNSRWLTYRFRIIERGTTYLGDRSLWLKHVDKRTVTPAFGDNVVTDSHTMHEQATSYSPDALPNILSVNQDTRVFYFDRVLSSSAWSQDFRKDLPMFELPRQPLISIGQLQHLHIAGRAPYAVGNAWGGTQWNRLFDDYFLSGMQAGISMPSLANDNPVIPHPRISLFPARGLGLTEYDDNLLADLGENSGVVLAVEGQFNLNSVSVPAWKAVLGSTVFKNFVHARRDRNLHDEFHQTANDLVQSQIDYPPGFSRFPQSIQELFDVDIEEMDNDLDRHFLNFKPGVTFLKPRTGTNGADSDFDHADDGLLEEFAAAVAEGVREYAAANGRPFLTLNEFITGNFRNGNSLLNTILEGDVDAGRFPRLAAGELRRPFGDNLDGWTPEERTPAWLSQADVLTSLAPFLSTRSDTFTIRSYGNVRDPISGETISRAWCEAVVQRVIVPMNETATLDEMAGVPSSAFGRQFKILSFRWLNESDI
ncbi:MAG: hypothetical protein JJU29_04760 [Verrucomicrobia bacterium]|nr:hypothetical protein [Verrucomicrobiota bacterium]MCH8510281.1 hypothetical protein [Kiritimatiellia bacterium]